MSRRRIGVRVCFKRPKVSRFQPTRSTGLAPVITSAPACREGLRAAPLLDRTSVSINLISSVTYLPCILPFIACVDDSCRSSWWTMNSELRHHNVPRAQCHFAVLSNHFAPERRGVRVGSVEFDRGPRWMTSPPDVRTSISNVPPRARTNFCNEARVMSSRPSILETAACVTPKRSASDACVTPENSRSILSATFGDGVE